MTRYVVRIGLTHWVEGDGPLPVVQLPRRFILTIVDLRGLALTFSLEFTLLLARQERLLAFAQSIDRCKYGHIYSIISADISAS